MAEHLGYDKHDPAGRNRGNSRNGKRANPVLTDSGEVAIEVPRDRDGSFEPVLVAKQQRRLSSIDEIVLSLYARGLTTGDIAAHFGQTPEADLSGLVFPSDDGEFNASVKLGGEVQGNSSRSRRFARAS
jgi:transposase-like protein